jgi:hypothetical protein
VESERGVMVALRVAGSLSVLTGSAHAALYPSQVMTCKAGMATLQTTGLTRCEYNDIINAVITTYRAIPSKCSAESCMQAEFAGCILRMAGHDFLDFSAGAGGSDGCTDLDADNNKGLSDCLYQGQFGLSLDQAYQPFCQTVSLADFFVISAEAIMMATRRNTEGSTEAGSLNFQDTFKWGRRTAETCPNSGGILPNPEGSCTDVDRVFIQNLGLDWRGAAALSGAHSLGRAHPTSSGYSGYWSSPLERRGFNNSYFVNLVTRGWIPEPSVNGNVGKNQWRRADLGATAEPDELMLNTDLCLAFDGDEAGVGVPGEMLAAGQTQCCAWLTPSEQQGTLSQGKTFCGTATVPPEPQAQRAACCSGQAVGPNCRSPEGNGGKAYADVVEFAIDDGAWIATFKDAWVKATQKGQEDNLQDLELCYDPQPALPGNLHFDCAAGEEHWKRGWSELKRGFCCKNAGVGCELAFDCQVGRPRYWKKSKKYFCCEHENLGCEEVFDCSAGVPNWQRGWSDLKKKYCCATEGVGCIQMPVPMEKYDATSQQVWQRAGVGTWGSSALLSATVLGAAVFFVRRLAGSRHALDTNEAEHPLVAPVE